MPIAIVGILSLAFLYFWNPAEIPHFPRCPFFALTGYKCPGCGTLRGIHALLHLHVLDAVRYNCFMAVSIPVVAALLLSSRLRSSVVLVRAILAATLVWWVVRNIIRI